MANLLQYNPYVQLQKFHQSNRVVLQEHPQEKSLFYWPMLVLVFLSMTVSICVFVISCFILCP